MTRELRCSARLHGVLTGPGVVEVKCSSRRCGADPTTVVLHLFDTVTGDLVGTTRYRQPTPGGSRG